MHLQFTVRPNKALGGDIRIPGDKSISHRSIMLASIAAGTTTVDGFLFGADNLATMGAMQALGVKISTNKLENTVTIEGVGKNGLKQAKMPLDMGNSGTAMRLLMGLLAGQEFDTTLVGDESLSVRPMARVATPLAQMGAKINLSEQGSAPITICGGQNLTGIDYLLPMPSAQVKSAILLAGLYATGETRVTQPEVSRDHTERMVQTFSYPVNTTGNKITLSGGGDLTATNIRIPADISSAAFFMVAATISPDSRVVLREVGINPTRIGIINILQSMGANIRLHNSTKFGEEPVADIEITSAELSGVDIDHDLVALAIDEMPIVMIAAANAKGITRIRGARELRVKETDRIMAMAMGLKQLGINCQIYDDGIDIEGGVLTGGHVESYSDHRIAMAFAIAGCAAKRAVTISDCKNVETSFPNFVELAKTLGMNIDSK